MRYCSVYGCSNNSAKNKELAYFAFPNPQKDRERAIIWLENIGTGHDVDSFNFKRKVVCSKHFDKSAFKRDLQAELLGLPEKKRLNPDAVPTIFDFPSPKKKKRKDSSMLKNDCKNKQNQTLVSSKAESNGGEKAASSMGKVIVLKRVKGIPKPLKTNSQLDFLPMPGVKQELDSDIKAELESVCGTKQPHWAPLDVIKQETAGTNQEFMNTTDSEVEDQKAWDTNKVQDQTDLDAFGTQSLGTTPEIKFQSLLNSIALQGQSLETEDDTWTNAIEMGDHTVSNTTEIPNITDFTGAQDISWPRDIERQAQCQQINVDSEMQVQSCLQNNVEMQDHSQQNNIEEQDQNQLNDAIVGDNQTVLDSTDIFCDELHSTDLQANEEVACQVATPVDVIGRAREKENIEIQQTENVQSSTSCKPIQFVLPNSKVSYDPPASLSSFVLALIQSTCAPWSIVVLSNSPGGTEPTLTPAQQRSVSLLQSGRKSKSQVMVIQISKKKDPTSGLICGDIPDYEQNSEADLSDENSNVKFEDKTQNIELDMQEEVAPKSYKESEDDLSSEQSSVDVPASIDERKNTPVVWELSKQQSIPDHKDHPYTKKLSEKQMQKLLENTDNKNKSTCKSDELVKERKVARKCAVVKEPPKPKDLPATRSGRKRKSVVKYSQDGIASDCDDSSDPEDECPVKSEQGSESEISEYDPEDDLDILELGNDESDGSSECSEDGFSELDDMSDEEVSLRCDIKPCPTTKTPSITNPNFIVSNQTAVKNSMVHAFETLPSCLSLGRVSDNHGLGVFATKPLEKYTQFGPLEGTVLNHDDISAETDLSRVWIPENLDIQKPTFVDTSDENKSNWCRYFRHSPKLANLVTSVRKDGIYFVTIAEIQKGDELCFKEPHLMQEIQKKHKKHRGKRACISCRITFPSKYLLYKHLCIFHPFGCKRPQVLKCVGCKKLFATDTEFEKHLSEDHTNDDGDFGVECKLCGKVYKRGRLLNVHIRDYHRPKAHICDDCGKEFRTRTALRAHIAVHKDFMYGRDPCSLCGKMVKRKRMSNHMSRHNKTGRTYSCDRCGKAFYDRSNMLIHMLTHSKVKPFQCQEDGCSVGYTTKQCLQIHYRKAHGYTDENMPAIQRVVPFTEKGYLQGTKDD